MSRRKQRRRGADLKTPLSFADRLLGLTHPTPELGFADRLLEKDALKEEDDRELTFAERLLRGDGIYVDHESPFRDRICSTKTTDVMQPT